VTVATDGSTSFDKKIIVKDDRHGWVVGHHFVCNSTNYVYGGTFKTAFNNSPGLLNDTALARAVARTAAHEAGHHGGLDDDGKDPSNTMGRPGLGPRVVTDSGFSTAAKTELASWVNGTSNKADAGLAADDFGDALVSVFGEYTTTEEIIDDADHFNATVEILGDMSDYELGWMNIYDGFVPKVSHAVVMDTVSMFCGFEIELAIRNVFTDQVFLASEFAAPPLFSNPIPAPMSSCPVVSADYFGTVIVDFPPLGIQVVMDAMPHNPTCGFLAYKDAFPDHGVPTVREWGIVVLAMLLIGYVVWRFSRRFKHSPEA
jgi:hypothetical protein